MTLGILGTLSDRKGWSLAAAAVARLAQSGNPVRLLIGGTGPPEARDQAERLCAQTGNQSRYFGEIRNPRESFIPDIDALLLPASAEGLPMSVLECLAAAVPVIATRVGGLPEILEDRVNGLFIQRDPVEIGGAIQMLLEDPALHASLSRNARQAFEIKGHVSLMAEGYRQMYLRVAPSLFGLEPFGLEPAAAYL
jgi:glycosyltransferase involved in cell wall biosynthesis